MSLNSLGFPQSPKSTRVVVAMSGGVDSSVVAAMLSAQGYDVVGVTMQLYNHGEATAKRGACCAGRDIRDARRVAERLGISHYVLDYEDLFRESVIDEFADSYLSGATPVPCIRCNERVKFRELLETAKDLDADCLATGHYIQRIMGRSGPEMHRAKDLERDQSYFLFSTTREQLGFLRFPLGTVISKAQTRNLAEEYGLAVADKPDSQDICFVPNGDYAAVIERLRPGAAEPGSIVDCDGQVLGQHDGVINFTIGQRKGLRIGGLRDPLYVVGLDAERREVQVGPRSRLQTDSIQIAELNWLGDTALEPQVGTAVKAKIRSTTAPTAAWITPTTDGGGVVQFATPETGVSSGQACVLYGTDGDRVLGGGWITGRLAKEEMNENDR